MADEYEVNMENETVLSVSCNAAAPDHIVLLLLHYLKKKIEGLPRLQNEWINFRQLQGGDGYYPVFYKRVIEPVKKKYGNSVEGFLAGMEKFNARKSDYGQNSVIIEPFERVPVLVALWPKTEEFSSEANVLFDRSIERILDTENVVILAEVIAHFM